MHIANEGIEAQKRYKGAAPTFIKVLIPLLIIFSVIGMFINPMSSVSTAFAAVLLISSTKSLKKATWNTIEIMVKRIVDLANEFQDEVKFVEPNTTIEIVPANLCIGENLEASNAFDIFKEGHYVIIKSMMDPYFIRSYENDEGEREEYLMEANDADIQTLLEEIPKYDEYIKKLYLKSDSIPKL